MAVWQGKACSDQTEITVSLLSHRVCMQAVLYPTPARASVGSCATAKQNLRTLEQTDATATARTLVTGDRQSIRAARKPLSVGAKVICQRSVPLDRIVASRTRSELRAGRALDREIKM